MGNLEEEATRILAERAEYRARKQAEVLAEDQQWAERLSEFLALVQRQNYVPEKTYDRSRGNLTAIEGWVIHSQPSDSYFSYAFGLLATATGDLYEFTAHGVELGQKPVISRFHRHQPYGGIDVTLVLGKPLESRALRYRCTAGSFAEYYATYTAASLA